MLWQKGNKSRNYLKKNQSTDCCIRLLKNWCQNFFFLFYFFIHKHFNYLIKTKHLQFMLGYNNFITIYLLIKLFYLNYFCPQQNSHKIFLQFNFFLVDELKNCVMRIYVIQNEVCWEIIA